MAKTDSILNRFVNCISGFWYIATTKNSSYEYVIEDIQLQEKNNRVSSLIYYRAIGARAIMYDSASELNSSDIFSKFSHAQSQAIVTLATLEKMITLDRETLVNDYKEYAEKCAKTFRLQRKK